MMRFIISKFSLIIIVILILAMVSGCGVQKDKTTDLQNSETSSETEELSLSLTLEELTKYDGKGENPGYIAVDGIIYDISKVPQWAGGMHRGFSAGHDVTEDINNSPHGVSRLKGIPIVGMLE
jgi:predicted heme/steroid binding protein